MAFDVLVIFGVADQESPIRVLDKYNRFHVVEIYHGVLVTIIAADLDEDNSK